MVRAASPKPIDLPMAPRVVIVDPGLCSNSGHHAELNRQLLAAGRAAGLAIECWVDQAFKAEDPAYRPAFHGCGYEDPRHWLDLPGSLHLAGRLQQQMRDHLSGEVHCWIAHSLLPFQLISLARLLQHLPGARVEVGILYAPGERLGGSTDPSAASPGQQRERELAIANARVAWSGLARATALAKRASATAQQYAAQRNTIRLRLETAFFNHEASLAKLSSARRGVAAALEAFRDVRLRYQTGLSSEIDVSFTQDQLINSLVRRLNATVAVNVSYARLLRELLPMPRDPAHPVKPQLQLQESSNAKP